MDDIESELERIQGIALKHAIDELDAADGLGLDSKTARGDRGFLTGMSARSLGVAVRIEQFLILRRREGFGSLDDEKDEKAAKVEMLRKARGEVTKILERVGSGSKAKR
jgi:hypothetical protein